MSQIDDSITYKIIVQNDYNEDYEFNNNIDSEYIDYNIYPEDGNNIIKANSSKTFYLTATYKELIPPEVFQSTSYVDSKTLTIFLPTRSKNPKTAYNFYTILLGILIICIMALYLFKKRKSIKFLIVLFGVSLSIPLFAHAICSYEIKINSNVEFDNPYLGLRYEGDYIDFNWILNNNKYGTNPNLSSEFRNIDSSLWFERYYDDYPYADVYLQLILQSQEYIEDNYETDYDLYLENMFSVLIEIDAETGDSSVDVSECLINPESFRFVKGSYHFNYDPYALDGIPLSAYASRTETLEEALADIDNLAKIYHNDIYSFIHEEVLNAFSDDYFDDIDEKYWVSELYVYYIRSVIYNQVEFDICPSMREHLLGIDVNTMRSYINNNSLIFDRP